MKCRLGCDTIETQYHIFEKCTPIFAETKLNKNIKLDKIYGTLEEQKSIIKYLIQIDETRKLLLEKEAIYDTIHLGEPGPMLLAASNI